MTTTQFDIIRPDDWHLHLRDGAALKNTVADAARYFGRAIIMPNLVPPVTNTDMAGEYRQRIVSAIPEGSSWQPLMVLYLTDNTTPEEISLAAESGFVKAYKLYPAGATTNSDSGVTSIDNIGAALERMEKVGMPLLIHGEVTHSHIDIFDREKAFIDQHMRSLCENFPELNIVFEHITTADAVQFVNDTSDKVAATITAHHLLYDRNHMLAGGIRPHYYCLPILKRNTHKDALINAATSGSRKFFLGTDSAPHAQNAKEAACGCAGCYTSFAGIELYAEVFDQANALDKLEGFASIHGPEFYNLPINTDKIRLVKESWDVPATIPLGDLHLAPLRANEQIHWKVIDL